MDLSRVSKEIKEISADTASGISVRLINDDLTSLEGSITGNSAADAIVPHANDVSRGPTD